MRKITTDSHFRPFHYFLLMVSVFTVFIGYGIALPVLPFLLETRFGAVAGFSIAWHTGMMTGVFMFTLFLFAPLWGKVSDRIGRRPVILLGLGGCVLALMAFAIVETLWLGYLTRALGGAVVSAVLPVALAYVADNSTGELRALRFARMSAAATFGFLIGPGLGGWLSGVSLSVKLPGVTASSFPFLVAATASLLVWIVVYLGLPVSTAKLLKPSRISTNPDSNRNFQTTSFNILLLLALLGMFGLGSFEVSLALHGQQLI